MSLGTGVGRGRGVSKGQELGVWNRGCQGAPECKGDRQTIGSAKWEREPGWSPD